MFVGVGVSLGVGVLVAVGVGVAVLVGVTVGVNVAQVPSTPGVGWIQAAPPTGVWPIHSSVASRKQPPADWQHVRA